MTGCAPTTDENIQRGNNYSYQPGYPEFHSTAFGFIGDQNNPMVKVVTDVVYNSLVYKETEDGDEKATILVEINIDSNVDGEPETGFYEYSYDLIKDEELSDNTYQTFSVNKNFSLYYGKHTIITTVTDANSGKSISRTQKTVVPHPEKDRFITDILLFGKNSSGTNTWKAITTYNVSQRYDSLKFLYQIHNNDSPIRVVNELIQFDSDTSYAQLPFYNAPLINNGTKEGIYYDKRTLIGTSDKTYSGEAYQTYELTYALPERGNYRFNIEVESNSTDTDSLVTEYQARDFGIKSANYPLIKSSRELAAPLIYLMNEDEYRKMMRINNPDSLKAAVDAFWLKEIDSQKKAQETLRLYYERVEEANRYFSNFKEGWKTDTGMIYIIFGPPWYNITHSVKMDWYYSFNRDDQDYTYTFFQPVVPNRSYPFQHWVLDRERGYFDIYYQQTHLWTTGRITTRPLF